MVYQYLLKAGSEKRWNTLADWNKETFAQAAGHPSEDDYRNHASDFDDYSDTAQQPNVKQAWPSNPG